MYHHYITTMLQLFHDRPVSYFKHHQYCGNFPNTANIPLATMNVDHKQNPRQELEQHIPLQAWADHILKWDTELLGSYDYQTMNITLFSQSIAACAHDLGQDAQALSDVVFLHELAHWASHQIPDAKHRMWESFSTCENFICEQWAQVLTYWVIITLQREDLKATFHALMQKQQEMYQLDPLAKQIMDDHDDDDHTFLLNSLQHSRTNQLSVMDAYQLESKQALDDEIMAKFHASNHSTSKPQRALRF